MKTFTLRSKFSTIFFASVLLLFGSCASMKPISEIPGVLDIDWTLHEGTNSSANARDPMELRSGKSYYAAIRYLQQDKKGRSSWKRLINYEGVYLSVDGALWSVSGNSLLAPADPFAALSPDRAVMKVHVPLGNLDSKSKEVALVLPVALPSFRGEDGDNGSDGDTSLNGDPDGEDGDDGEDGSALDLELARYDLSGSRFEGEEYGILVYDIRSNRLWLLSRRSTAIELDASGGAGGSGGQGASRQIPEESTETFLKGGDGGDGGNGGNGGLVHMIVSEGSSLDMAFAVNVSRGRGGKAGGGGEGDRKESGNLLVEILSTLMVNGSSGEDGRDGAQGRFWRESKPMDSMFLGIKSPLFDRGRLLP